MSNISSNGLKLVLIASVTFPLGIEINAFATDGDPFIVEDVDVNKHEVDINGNGVTYSRAVPIRAEINLQPNSEEDKNLSILLSANSPGKNKLSIHDDITLIAVNPNGTREMYLKGTILGGAGGNTMTNDGKIKSKNYKFSFTEKV